MVQGGQEIRKKKEQECGEIIERNKCNSRPCHDGSVTSAVKGKQDEGRETK